MGVVDVLFARNYGPGDAGDGGNLTVAGLGAAFGRFGGLRTAHFKGGGNFEVAASLFYRSIGWTSGVRGEFWSGFGSLAVVAGSGVFGCGDPYRLRIDSRRSLSRLAQEEADSRGDTSRSQRLISCAKALSSAASSAPSPLLSYFFKSFSTEGNSFVSKGAT